MRIGIDIDGTICNTIELQYYYAIEYILKNKLAYDVTKRRTHHDIKKIFNLSAADEKNILEVAMFYIENNPEYISILPFADKYINRLKSEGHEIIFITRRSSEYWQHPTGSSEKYLKLNNIKFDNIIIDAEDKGAICEANKIDVMIDDQIDNCKLVNKRKIPTIMVNYLYNQRYKNDYNHRANGWPHIYYIIKNLMKNK